MPNPVQFKSNAPTQTNVIKNNNFYVGTGGQDYGPTSATGWYAGINPPTGVVRGYTLYENKATDGPSIRTFPTSGSLSNTLSNYFGHSFVHDNEGIVSASLASDIAVLNREVPQFPNPSRLQFHFDANLAFCSISGSHEIFSAGKAFRTGSMSSQLWEYTGISDHSGSWAFQGTSDFIETQLSDNNFFTSPFTIAMWVRIPSPSSAGDMVVDKSDGTGLAHDGISIKLANSNLLGTDFCSFTTTVDGVDAVTPKNANAVWTYDDWNLLVFSFRNGTDFFWRGGATTTRVDINRSSLISNISATNPLTLGKNFDLDQDHLSGSIAMFSVYNTQFTDEAVIQLYNETKNYFVN